MEGFAVFVHVFADDDAVGARISGGATAKNDGGGARGAVERDVGDALGGEFARCGEAEADFGAGSDGAVPVQVGNGVARAVVRPVTIPERVDLRREGKGESPSVDGRVIVIEDVEGGAEAAVPTARFSQDGMNAGRRRKGSRGCCGFGSCGWLWFRGGSDSGFRCRGWFGFRSRGRFRL